MYHGLSPGPPKTGATALFKYTRLNAEHVRVRALPNPLFSSDSRVTVTKRKPQRRRPAPTTFIHLLRVGVPPLLFLKRWA